MGELVELFGEHYGKGFQSEIYSEADAPHEANFLKLDTSLLKSMFGWKPRWHIDEAVEKTVEWTREWMRDGSVQNMNRVTNKQIEIFSDV